MEKDSSCYGKNLSVLKTMTIYEIMELEEIMEQIVVNGTAIVRSFLQVGCGGSFSIEIGQMVYSRSSINYRVFLS